jgi:hypothetical protein
MPLYPRSVVNQGTYPNSLSFHCFHLWTWSWIYQGVWGCINLAVATPLWPSVGVKPNTPKVGDLESSGTPKCLEFDRKAQNCSHWGVLGVIGKVLKRRYRKWPQIGHLDIFSPSYGQKKGRESNWQFDSRSLKVRNRPLPDIRFESATRRWKRSQRGLQLWFRPRHDPTLQSGVMSSQSPGTPTGTISGQFRDSNFGVPGKRAIWM